MTLTTSTPFSILSSEDGQVIYCPQSVSAHNINIHKIIRNDNDQEGQEVIPASTGLLGRQPDVRVIMREVNMPSGEFFGLLYIHVIKRSDGDQGRNERLTGCREVIPRSNELRVVYILVPALQVSKNDERTGRPAASRDT